MKLVEKTSKKILIEIEIKDINSKGFDKVWDKLRDAYPNEDFDVDKITIQEEEKKIFVSLKKKTLLLSC